ncbi:MAG: hypothetical protein WCV81_02665 [Microgenomates group bacterium]|jgi:hypothetical protein
MKSIEVGKGKTRINVNGADGTSYYISVKNEAALRKLRAAERAHTFFTGNCEQIVRLMSGNEGDESDLIKNNEFTGMVNELRRARVGKKKFLHSLSQWVENSPSSPALEIGRDFARRYTNFVYEEVKRLGIEAKTKK